MKKGKKFDLYTHMNGTTAKDIRFALKKGEYRLKIMAKAGCVSQIAAYESDYQHLAKDSYGKTKKKAVNLYKTDFDLESMICITVLDIISMRTKQIQDGIVL